MSKSTIIDKLIISQKVHDILTGRNFKITGIFYDEDDANLYTFLCIDSDGKEIEFSSTRLDVGWIEPKLKVIKDDMDDNGKT